MYDFSDVTLVIPSYNRSRYLHRLNSFWKNYNINIIVVDGSDERVCAEIRWGANIQYFYKPISFFERLRFAASIVETSYVSLLSDDEFFLPSAIASSIQELEVNPDLISCIGQCMAFNRIGNIISGNRQYPLLNGYSLINDNAFDRMSNHMSQYVPSTIYSIMKKESWLIIIDIITERVFDVYAISELQFELAAAYLGKSKAINQLFWLRSHENIPIRNEKGLDPSKTLPKWWSSSDPNIIEEKNEFISYMVSKLFKKGLNSASELEHGITKSIDDYYQQCRKGFLERVMIKANRLYDLRFPLEIRKSILELEGDGVEVNFKDMEDVINCINSSNS